MITENKTANFSTLKSNKRFLFVSSFFLLLFVLYIVFFFRLTLSFIMSSMIALGVLLSLGGLLYYSVYRWFNPTLTVNRWVLRLVSGSMLGAGLGIWFVQQKSLSIDLLSKIDQFIPVLHSQPIDAYERYYPMVNFLFFVFAGAILFCLFFGGFEAVFKKFHEINNKLIAIISYALLLVSVTTCIFCTDALQQGPGQKSIIFFGGTETYVTDRIGNSLSFLQDIETYGGFLNGRGPDGSFAVYQSQTGFYASILKLVQTVTKIDPDDFIKGSRVLLSFVLASLLTILSLSIKKKFGFLASIVFSIFTILQYWIIGPAGYLLWFYFVLFTPIFISAYVYPLVIQNKLTTRRFLFFTVFGTFLVFLRGYEYFPGLIASAAIPVIYYEMQAGKRFRDISIGAIKVCLAGLVGLLFVLVIHFVQLSLYYKNFSKPIHYLIDRAVSRSAGGDTNLLTPLQIFTNWLYVKVFYISDRFFAIVPQWKAKFDLYNNFANLYIFTFIEAGIAVLLRIFQNNRFFKNPQVKSEIHLLFNLAITTLVALIASWSWFPALGHMAHHYHMNGIMYMIPFGITLFIFTGVLAQTLIRWLVVGLGPSKITQ